ncbi:MAG: transposase, partial [Opitutales bacterium]|nr:transposase [Opitutales bacterium]
MRKEKREPEAGTDGVAEAPNPVVSRRVPGKVRRLPRACASAGCDGYYHVVSRINGRARLLTDTRREAFRELLGRVAGFCGVEVLTYCFMENHFHLLVRVPGEIGEIDDAELLRRAGLLYGAPASRRRQPLTLAGIRGALERGTAEEREAMRALLLGRMGSLPMFVKILKQRFSLRYNREHGRLGTLWEGPFRSVLVEPTRRALSVVGAYIDLNPVRAGL